jgi:hypothetical protein
VKVVPGMDYIKQRARKYNVKKDGKTESCAICLDQYEDKENRKIVELDCKHIFH